MAWSSRSWLAGPLRMDLAEIMDDLEAGWAGWSAAPEGRDEAGQHVSELV